MARPENCFAAGMTGMRSTRRQTGISGCDVHSLLVGPEACETGPASRQCHLCNNFMKIACVDFRSEIHGVAGLQCCATGRLFRSGHSNENESVEKSMHRLDAARKICDA
ncbi:hypothetical protein [Taklimakanibacter lacteus]|uniref:hypothetical protein n=1 Tax=Taklimakanibacter lacteus TaxID=2268456 RepID=UPI0013C4D08A